MPRSTGSQFTPLCPDEYRSKLMISVVPSEDEHQVNIDRHPSYGASDQFSPSTSALQIKDESIYLGESGICPVPKISI